MKKYLIAATAALLFSTNAMAATNLVQNGGFETTTGNASQNFEIGKTYGNPTGWTSTQGYNLLFNAAVATTVNAAGTYAYTGNEKMWAATASSQGGNFLALDGDVNARGALSQVINNLIVGNTYTVSFEWGAGQLQSRVGDTTEKLTVGFGNDSFDTTTISNQSKGFSGWNAVSQNFVATSTSQALTFLSLGTPTGLPPIALLDNVSVTAAVPEPATWGMMILGFGAIGSAMRRRRTTSSLAAA